MILVTGGAGFIGSRLVLALIEMGREVAVAEIVPAAPWQNLNRLGGGSLVSIVRHDEVASWCEDRRSKLEAVVHLGAVADTLCESLDYLAALNVGTSLALWEFCRRAQIPFLWASSAAVYGDGSAGFEDGLGLAGLLALRPLNLYGWSKLAVDRAIGLDVLALDVPPQWCGLRFFNVYGPGESHKGRMMSMPGQLLAAARAGRRLRLFRDGEQRRDFVYVDDAVDLILWLLANPTISGCFNVGTGVARSFNELVSCLSGALRKPLGVDWLEIPPDLAGRFQAHTRASLGRLRACGYRGAFRSLERGVADYVSATL